MPTKDYNKPVKSITIKFDTRNLTENEVYQYFAKTNIDDRKNKLIELYNLNKNITINSSKEISSKHIEKMSIFEERLFDLVEKAIVTPSPVSYGLPVQHPQIINAVKPDIPAKKNKGSFKSNDIDYSVDMGVDVIEDEIDYDSIIDNSTEEGLRD